MKTGNEETNFAPPTTSPIGRGPGEAQPGEEAEGFTPEEPAAGKEGKEGKDGKPAKDKGDDEPTAAELRRERDSERARRIDAEKDRDLWADQVRSGRGRREEPKPEPVVEEADVDLVEALSSGDKKLAAKAIKQLGYVSKEEVAEMVRTGVREGVTTARQELTVEQSLVNEYPDLNDDGSEMVGVMRDHYARLEKRGLKGDTLLEAAANAAAADLGIVRESVAGKGRRRTGEEPAPRARERHDADERRDNYDDDRRPARRRSDDRETEEEREERISAQSRPRGQRGTREREAEDDLNPVQRSIAAKLGVSVERYKARARAGVSLSGSMLDR